MRPTCCSGPGAPSRRPDPQSSPLCAALKESVLVLLESEDQRASRGGRAQCRVSALFLGGPGANVRRQIADHTVSPVQLFPSASLVGKQPQMAHK